MTTVCPISSVILGVMFATVGTLILGVVNEGLRMSTDRQELTTGQKIIFASACMAAVSIVVAALFFLGGNSGDGQQSQGVSIADSITQQSGDNTPIVGETTTPPPTNIHNQGPQPRDTTEGVTPSPLYPWQTVTDSQTRIYGSDREWVKRGNLGTPADTLTSAQHTAQQFAHEFSNQTSWETPEARAQRLAPYVAEGSDLLTSWALDIPPISTSSTHINRRWQVAEVANAEVFATHTAGGIRIALAEATVARASFQMNDNGNGAIASRGGWQIIIRMEDHGNGWRVVGAWIPTDIPNTDVDTDIHGHGKAVQPE